MRKWIVGFLVSLVVIPVVPVHAQSAEGGASIGPLLLVGVLLAVIIVGSALVIRRLQFTRNAKTKAQRAAPATPAPARMASPPSPAVDAQPSAADEDAAYEAQRLAQRESARLDAALTDARQSVTFIAEKLQTREAELSEQANLLNVAKRQHDAAYQEIQATRGLLDFHKHSLSHMGDDDTHRKMELQDAIREASLAVIQTDKEQAEREERIRLHQSRIADLKQECEYLSQERDRLQHEAQHIAERLGQAQPRQAA